MSRIFTDKHVVLRRFPTSHDFGVAREIVINRLERAPWCVAACFYGSIEQPYFSLSSSDVNVFAIIEPVGKDELFGIINSIMESRWISIGVGILSRQRCEQKRVLPISRALYDVLPPVVSGLNIKATPRWWIREDSLFPSPIRSLRSLIKDAEYQLSSAKHFEPFSAGWNNGCSYILDAPYHLARNYLHWRGITTTGSHSPQDLQALLLQELNTYGDRDWETWAGQTLASFSNLFTLKDDYRARMADIASLPPTHQFVSRSHNQDMLQRVWRGGELLTYLLDGLTLAIRHSRRPS